VVTAGIVAETVVIAVETAETGVFVAADVTNSHLGFV
jgi:hypothetical protein